MTTTNQIILASVLMGLVIVYIIKTVGSAHLSKRYVLKLLRELFPEKEFSEAEISLEALKIKRFSDNVSEKSFTHIQAKTEQGETVDLEVRLYNPEAAMDEDKYEASIKNARPKEDNIDNPISGQGHAAGVEMAQNMMREQNKLEQEDRLIQAKLALHERDVAIVQHLNQYTTLFPTIYRYIPKKRLTCYGFTGEESLTDYLGHVDEIQKAKALKKVVAALAQLHNHDQEILSMFPEKIVLDADSYKVALERSMDNMVKAKLVQPEEVRALANEYYPIAQVVCQEAERGLRIKNCSSYELYVNQEHVYLRDWDGFSFDFKALNLAEILNDPVCELSRQAQDELLQFYAKTRLQADATRVPELMLKRYDFAVTGFLVTQLNYMAVYVSKMKEIEANEAPASMLVNWDAKHLKMLLDNLLYRLNQYEESQAFAQELQAIFTPVLTSL